MSQPTPYERQFDFTDFQTANPSDPLPGNQVDAELNNVKQTVDQTLSNLALLQRDDGALANRTVGVDQMKAEVNFGLNAVADWSIGTAYLPNNGVWIGAKLYRCLVGHTSTVFADDLAAGYWSLLVDIATPAQEQVDLAQAAAQTAIDNASATSADAFATAADREQTGLDAAATAEDRMQTGADVTAAAASAAAAASSAAEGLYNDVVSKTYADSPIVPLLLQEGTLYRIDTSGGNVVVNLSALSVYTEDMKFAFVKDTDDANTVTINRGGTDTISGGTNIMLTKVYEVHVLVGDYASGTWIDCAQATGIPDSSITLAKLVDVATATVFYRKTAGTGAPEVQTLATLKGDLGLSGTNTGDQTLPVKATGTEIDTGTDDAKFATAKALKDSHNVPNVVPGTSGNVLTSDGTDWTSAPFPAPPPTSPILLSSISTAQTITSAGALTLAHGLGVAPKMVNIILTCVTADAGYAVGDKLFPLAPATSGSSPNDWTTGCTIKFDATNLYIRYGSLTNSAFIIGNGTTGAMVGAANAKWIAQFQAFA